ncbi:TolC family protein [Flavobacterium aquicola]|uniref:Outer membrane efflux protein n=1 Tax=Flavobacterium aquicola TaxID=1682742 RepID=A0A3E0EMJ4_9FLAO|nr:hypothetical protein C8P67_104102 [Flavobacterium aquicola]
MGLANYLEVIRSQENELDAQLEIIDAEYKKMNAVVELYRALGRGWNQ